MTVSLEMIANLITTPNPMITIIWNIWRYENQKDINCSKVFIQMGSVCSRYKRHNVAERMAQSIHIYQSVCSCWNIINVYPTDFGKLSKCKVLLLPDLSSLALSYEIAMPLVLFHTFKSKDWHWWYICELLISRVYHKRQLLNFNITEYYVISWVQCPALTPV